MSDTANLAFMAELLSVHLDFRVEEARNASRRFLPVPLGEASLLVAHIQSLVHTVTEGKMSRQPVPPKLRFAILKRDGHRCQYCGRAAPDVPLQVDHIIAVAKGGKTTRENLRTACADCNAGKGDGDPSHPPLSQTIRVFLESEGFWVENPYATAEFGPHCL